MANYRRSNIRIEEAWHLLSTDDIVPDLQYLNVRPVFVSPPEPRRLSPEELTRRGYIEIKPLGWVHRSKTPNRRLINTFYDLYLKDRRRAKRWANTFMTCNFVQAEKKSFSMRSYLKSLLGKIWNFLRCRREANNEEGIEDRTT